MKPLHLVALLCGLATAFAAPSATMVKWCVISDPELRKCQALKEKSPVFSCVKRETPLECIGAIKAGEADAITLSDVHIYTAGQRNYGLVPIIAEDYSSSTTDACYYSVAVVKKNTEFNLKNLRGKKSCHSGLDDAEGWNFPIGTLLTTGVLDWAGVDTKPLLEAVAEFFSASCVPGVTGYPNLCQLCGEDCSKSSRNPYSGDAGAFRCLAEDAGQVAFINPTAIPASEKKNYELLCKDNSRAPIDSYKTCNLGRVPAHAVVSRKDAALTELIWTSLTTVRGFNLFSPENYGGKNLMFSDSTVSLQQVPPDTDSFLYLGSQYMSMIYSLKKGTVSINSLLNIGYQTLPHAYFLFSDASRGQASSAIKWCAVGHAETAKCDNWQTNSYNTDSDTSAIECQTAQTVEDCFKMIMRKEADAIAVDGGQVYTAGKCGLVPAMAEQYDEAKCGSTGVSASSYFAVAVVKKGSGVTWANLKDKRSCHTGIGRTAGWNIPMGHIHRATNDCDFTKYFSSGCAPGAEPSSPFCRQCIGSGKTVEDDSKCKANAVERYYGYAGAFRCLAEDAGDVAFIKHTIVGENTNGNGPDWAKSLKTEDFELICPGKGPVPISDFESCNLALVPAHAVITRPEIRSNVVRVLQEQQAKFGNNGSNNNFRMFQSVDGKNLLFKDSTKCLQEIQDDSYETFLGTNYMAAMQSLRQCSATAPDLEKSCTFNTCQ